MRLKTNDIVYREDLYPRFKNNPATIQAYSENVDQLPPIEVNQHHELLDGYHRWKAHETAGIDEIEVTITETKSDAEAKLLAIERNAKHGQQLTRDEKKVLANRLFGDVAEDVICNVLAISRKTFSRLTAQKAKQREADTNRLILETYLDCHTHEAIAGSVGLPRQSVTARIAEIVKNGRLSDSDIFGNFEHDEPDDSGRRIYTIWNFSKATNEVRHFGNIPPEIIDNLLYLYTKPFDVVFDPFGGGGSTIDKCVQRQRRHYVSDLNPIPARSDIRKHDITTGLPGDLPVPDLVFLDPPYWKQAEKKYSEDATDLANIDLEAFLATIGNIAKAVKRKWVNAKRDRGTLALIIGPWKQDGKMLDLSLLCYERISKFLPLTQRIIVPYNTQVHGGAYVERAKQNKELLYLHRDLMVFSYGDV
jgi:DNA modification methylase